MTDHGRRTLIEGGRRSCPQCGAAAEPGARYCGWCGAWLLTGQVGGSGSEDVESTTVGGEAALRVYSTFRWGDILGMIDAKTSVSFDGRVLGPWLPSGFDFRVATTQGVHHLEITPPTSLLGRLFGFMWRRPEITFQIPSAGVYEASLFPVAVGLDGYRWEIVCLRAGDEKQLLE